MLGGLSAIVNLVLPGHRHPGGSGNHRGCGCDPGSLRQRQDSHHPKLNKIFMIGALSYLGYGLVSMLTAGLFGFSVNSMSIGGIPLGLPIALIAVAMATYSLLIDSPRPPRLWMGSAAERVLAPGFRPDRIAGVAGTLRFCAYSCTWQASSATT